MALELTSIESGQDSLAVRITSSTEPNWFYRTVALFGFGSSIVPLAVVIASGSGWKDVLGWLVITSLTSMGVAVTFWENSHAIVRVSISRHFLEYIAYDANQNIRSSFKIPTDQIETIGMSTDNSSIGYVTTQDGRVQSGWLYLDEYRRDMVELLSRIAPHVRLRF